LLAAVGVVVGVSVVVFCMVRVIPGDPARIMLPESASPEQVQAMRHLLGLDQPLPVQYLVFVGQALRGDLGRSLFYGQPTVQVVLEHLPATLALAGAALALALVVAVPLGVLSAVRRDTVWDWLGMTLALVGQSVPAFWLGLMLILVFAVYLGLLPSSGIGGPDHLLLPSVTLAASLMALATRLVRSGLLDVQHEDWMRTARAKGLTERAVVYRHGLRNTLIPLVTVVGLQCGALLGGAVIVETVFAWPGVGTVVYTAINARDYPLIQTSVLLLSLCFVLINLVVDVLYAYLDPRIHYG
jgi:peptide/nickel transport system permease protein